MRPSSLLIIGAAALALMVGAVKAQEAQSTNRVAANTDWAVFVEDDPTQCWVVSAPKDTVNTREGSVVAARRGDIRLWVSYWPGADKRGEVSFTGGYPFAEGSLVTLEIGSSTYEMFTDGEIAWAASPSDDAKIITSMKRGAEAVITGVSSRGTTTKDTFSLLGFTASIEDADQRCSG